MKKSHIVFITAIALSAFALASDTSAETDSGQSQPAKAPSTAADIEFEESVYDFGTIYQGESASKIFRFKNMGSGALIIERLKSSCSCAVAVVTSRKITAGESGEIKVVFDSSGRMGKQSKAVYVHSNDPDQPVSKLLMRGFVKTSLVMTPPSVNFGNIRKGMSPSRDINLQPEEGIDIVKVEPSAQYIKTELTKDEDKKAWNLSLRLASDAPIGPLREKVTIQTTSQCQPIKNITVFARVIGDIKTSYERMVFISSESEGDLPEPQTIKIKSRSNTPFTIKEIKSEPELLSFKISPDTASPEFLLTAAIKEGAQLKRINGIISVYTAMPERTIMVIPYRVIIRPRELSEVRVYLFYSQDCESCHIIKESYLPGLQRKYPSLKIKSFDIDKIEDYKLMLSLEKKYGRIKNPPPTIIVDEYMLDGEREIRKHLERLISQIIERGGSDWPEASMKMAMKEAGDEALIADKFKQLGIFLIIGAGLLDGINPCAFTTMIFLISYLHLIGCRKKEILIVGSTFTAGVFIAYLGVGIGLFEFIRQLTALLILRRIISFILAAGAFILGVLSLYDFIKIRQGRLKDISLQLPKLLKDKIHAVIRENFSLKRYAVATIFTGFFVAFLEFPCTGQVYFPIVAVLQKFSALRIKALIYLVLYNLMFIAPLIVVFIAVYLGATSRKLINLFQKQAGVVKLLTALLFFILAGVILIFF